MYRKGIIYDEIKKVIISIYLDYDFKIFPIDPHEVCRKMGVAVIPYSCFGREQRRLLKKQSEYGFFVPATSKNVATIYYNDFYGSLGAQLLTILHELKHYIYEDADDLDDDLADFFARYFMCPIPYLLLKNIDTPNEVVSFCGVSYEAACNVCANLVNRKKKYGYRLFDYEIPLIEHLEPVLLEVYQKEGDAYDLRREENVI